MNKDLIIPLLVSIPFNNNFEESIAYAQFMLPS